MATKKKLLQAAAGNAGGGAGLDVDEVFSTYLYEGTGSAQTITNGIDLSGEGGLVWTKSRSDDYSDHLLFDTERGALQALYSHQDNASENFAQTLTSFNSNGFSVGTQNFINKSSSDFASWAFLKSKRFFDIQTWTGDGVAGREIAHNLDHTVGMMILKETSGSGSWQVWHREGAGSGTSSSGQLNSTAAFNNALVQYYFGDDTQKIDPTSTAFTVSDHSAVNASGSTYVAYLFAHNDGDGEFGPDGDADIIKCGSYTGNGSTTGPEIDLGFEPQWIMFKDTSATGDWQIMDVMRGLVVDGDDEVLQPNTTSAESTYTGGKVNITPTGFQLKGSGAVNTSGRNYIYMAIRRGTAVPESATDVFYVEESNNPNKFVTTGFVTDLALQKHTALSSDWYLADRLRGENKWLSTNSTAAELVGTDSAYYTGWDYMNGVDMNIYPSQSNDHIFHMWKRAPKYMDCIAYLGNSTAGRTVAHNLGVAPEMMWLKIRGTAATSWYIYHKDIGNTNFLNFDNGASAANSGAWNNTTPTDSVFTLGTQYQVNGSGQNIIAYLFATLAGISKVGSVTHSGTTNVDCGFSSGARFILLKRTDATGDWYVWDSVRGIVSGNDPYLLLNTTGAEVTNTDYIDPLSSGFTITSSFTAGDYIFYAIA